MSATDAARFTAALTRAVKCLDLSLTDDQIGRMLSHFELVREANRSFNLTRITEPHDAAVKLYADSLAVSAWANSQKISIATAMDVGTGAGFPAIPLAIARADWRITAVDSTGKKARFVEGAAERLGLKNVSALHARAGERSAGGRFNLLTFKAIGPVDQCQKTATKLVAPRGYVVIFKTAAAAKRDLVAMQKTCRETGFKPRSSFDYELPGDDTGPLRMTLIIFQRG